MYCVLWSGGDANVVGRCYERAERAYTVCGGIRFGFVDVSGVTVFATQICQAIEST